MNLRKSLTFRVIFLLAIIILSIVFINPSFNVNGVAIRSVEVNSTAYDSGVNVRIAINPRDREIIIQINNQQINSIKDFADVTKDLKVNDTVKILTDKREYAFILDSNNLGVTVSEPSSTNLRKGLDLEGGSRVILKPEEKLSDDEFTQLIETMQLRLNTFGLSDIKIRAATDLQREKFVIVEVAGATKEDIRELVASQGKF